MERVYVCVCVTGRRFSKRKARLYIYIYFFFLYPIQAFSFEKFSKQLFMICYYFLLYCAHTDFKSGLSVEHLVRTNNHECVAALLTVDPRGGHIGQADLMGALQQICDETEVKAQSEALAAQKGFDCLKKLVINESYMLRTMTAHTREKYDAKPLDRRYTPAHPLLMWKLYDLITDRKQPGEPAAPEPAAPRRHPMPYFREQKEVAPQQEVQQAVQQEQEQVPQQQEVPPSDVSPQFNQEEFCSEMVMSDGTSQKAILYTASDRGFIIAHFPSGAHTTLAILSKYIVADGMSLTKPEVKSPAKPKGKAKSKGRPKIKPEEKDNTKKLGKMAAAAARKAKKAEKGRKQKKTIDAAPAEESKENKESEEEENEEVVEPDEEGEKPSAAKDEKEDEESGVWSFDEEAGVVKKRPAMPKDKKPMKFKAAKKTRGQPKKRITKRIFGKKPAAEVPVEAPAPEPKSKTSKAAAKVAAAKVAAVASGWAKEQEELLELLPDAAKPVSITTAAKSYIIDHIGHVAKIRVVLNRRIFYASNDR